MLRDENSSSRTRLSELRALIDALEDSSNALAALEERLAEITLNADALPHKRVLVGLEGHT